MPFRHYDFFFEGFRYPCPGELAANIGTYGQLRLLCFRDAFSCRLRSLFVMQAVDKKTDKTNQGEKKEK